MGITMTALLVFLLLQIADAGTTLLFLNHGIGEANPLIAAAFRVSMSPALSLVLVKAAGCAVALYAWRSGRRTLLRRANLFFAACVIWNCAALTAR